MRVDPKDKGKSTLVLVTQNNEVFWVNDVFGSNQSVARLKSLKRSKSMKPEVLVGMPNVNEANIFWIEPKTQSGVLMKVGKKGGSTKIDIRLDIEPMCTI